MIYNDDPALNDGLYKGKQVFDFMHTSEHKPKGGQP